MEWRADNARASVDIVEWLADNGYDSPAADCSKKVTIDRRIKVGDMLAFILRDDGSLRLAMRLTSWHQFDGWTLGRVTHVEDDYLGVSSGGRWIAIPTDTRALDRPWTNVVYATANGVDHYAPIEPNVATQTVEIKYPCYAADPIIDVATQVSVR